MQIKLINCNTRLLVLGIDLNNGGTDQFNSKLSTYFLWLSWNYGVDAQDKMTIDVADGTIIPDLSQIGEVVLE